MKIVTRIAPSPTGYLHFGLARTALFNFLYAKKYGGEFVVRIEDTDAARNRPEFESDIIEQLSWLGLTADRTFRQSEHMPRHRELLTSLIESGKAYVSKEPAKDDPVRTVEVIRLKSPKGNVAFTDLIRGEISFNTDELGDFVIARSLSEPLYHFAVVVDDHDEGVTHVIRGDDHISNTPRQILIQRALGFDTPAYAHLPLILMPDKSKMSKRKHEVSVRHYRESGIIPGALVNFIALIGWTPKSNKEILNMEEMVAEFDVADLHKSGAIFNFEKLRWFNREYLLKMPSEEFAETALSTLKDSLSSRSILYTDEQCEKLHPLLREKIHTWNDIKELVDQGEFDYFFQDPALSAADIPQKGSNPTVAVQHLRAVAEILENVSDSEFVDAESIKSAVWDYATKEGRGEVLWPLRFSLSGRPKSPDPFVIISIIGKEVAIRRIKSAVKALETP